MESLPRFPSNTTHFTHKQTSHTNQKCCHLPGPWSCQIVCPNVDHVLASSLERDRAKQKLFTHFIFLSVQLITDNMAELLTLALVHKVLQYKGLVLASVLATNHKLSRSTGKRSRSQHDIMYQHKKAIIQAQLSCRRSNLVKIIPKPSVGRFWNRNNSASDCSFKSGTEFHHITGDTLQMFKVKGQRWRSQRKVMYQKYNTATVTVSCRQHRN